MRQIVLIIISLVMAAAAASGQSFLENMPREAPDFDSIYNEITDRTSPYYYPRLMEEFERNDTTMKLDKYRRLYYGALLAEDYDPYRPSAIHPVDHTTGIALPSMLTAAECDSIISYATEALADDPFDLVQIYHLSQALRSRGRTSLANVWNYKLRQLLMAIMSSGTGTDEENAWVVIEPQHEYMLISALGLKGRKAIFIEPFFDYITVTDADGKDLGGLYFNIASLLDQYWTKHPEE